MCSMEEALGEMGLGGGTKEESEPEPEEPEECAICLLELSVDGEGGEATALLRCSHVFDAGCLQRWKDKCLEKGLRFTCAMCRADVVVAAAAGAGAAETRWVCW